MPKTLIMEVIDATLCTAFEGGITSWCRKVEPTQWVDGMKYASDAISHGADIRVYPRHDVVDDKTIRSEHLLTRKNMRKGLSDYCAAHKVTMLDIDDNPLDAADASEVVERALFGEPVFC